MAKLGVENQKALFRRLKISQSIWKSLKEFFAATAIHCYHYLTDSERPWQERLMWWIIHIISASMALFIVMNSWNRFTANPTITTLESTQYSIYNLPFPAVAICPNNKISKAAALQYANELLQKKYILSQYKDLKKLMYNIQYMGRLYDQDISNSEEYLAFQDMLDNIDANTSSGVFDTRQRMTTLAPKCEDLLVKCRWGGKDSDCLEIFEFRRTSEGLCCVFNIVRPVEKNQPMKTPFKPVGIESFYGLTVLLNLSNVDYFYPLRNFVGVMCLISNPYQFADSTIGGVKEVVVSPGYEMLIGINLQTMRAEKEIERYSVTKRGCLFAHENIEEFGGNYNYGDCLVKCKLRSIMALCRCIPFNFPINFPDIDITSMPVCNLQHTPCLNKYRNKWRTYRPREFIKELEREMEDSLDCLTCWPSCSNSIYNTEVVSSKLTFKFRNTKSITNGVEDSPDLTLIRVYFPMSDSTLFKIDVLYTWYEILSEYGGILGLCLGCSIISAVELFYFLTFRLYQNLFSNRLTFMTKFMQRGPRKFGGDNNNALTNSKFDFLH